MQWLKIFTLLSGSFVVCPNAASIPQQAAKGLLLKSSNAVESNVGIVNKSPATSEVSADLEANNVAEVASLAEQENRMQQNTTSQVLTTNEKRVVDMWETSFRIFLLRTGDSFGLKCHLTFDIWYNYDAQDHHKFGQSKVLEPPFGSDFRPSTNNEGQLIIDNTFKTARVPTNVYRASVIDIRWDMANLEILETGWVTATPDLGALRTEAEQSCWDDYHILKTGFEIKLIRCIKHLQTI